MRLCVVSTFGPSCRGSPLRTRSAAFFCSCSAQISSMWTRRQHQGAVGKEVEAQWQGTMLGHHLAVTGGIDRAYHPGAPVGHPQLTVVPARRLQLT